MKIGGVLSLPRISCNLITANRRDFIARSVKCFLAQTYEEKELVVYDNGTSPILDQLPRELVGPGRMIRYFRAHFTDGKPRAIGTLRNTAADVSTGELIATWDDDDWYHPDRLVKQAAELFQQRNAKKKDIRIVGYHSCLWYDEVSDPPCVWKYDQGGGAYALGSSLLFLRSHWRTFNFLDVNGGEDNAFIGDGDFLRAIPGVVKAGTSGKFRPFMIARMHPVNNQRSIHDVIRRAWEQDPERVNKVWSRLEDEATVESIRSLLA